MDSAYWLLQFLLPTAWIIFLLTLLGVSVYGVISGSALWPAGLLMLPMLCFSLVQSVPNLVGHLMDLFSY